MSANNTDRIDLQQHNRLAVYGVRRFTRKDETKDSSWTLIGTAFPCSDGSLNVVLDYVPATGASLNIRPFKPRTEA
ncbi:MAG TPA: hypothetical protein VKM54_25575 [Myxococcota bacterium]|nr:hypothetical protein [Myxococcota bacterium]